MLVVQVLAPTLVLQLCLLVEILVIIFLHATVGIFQSLVVTFDGHKVKTQFCLGRRHMASS